MSKVFLDVNERDSINGGDEVFGNIDMETIRISGQNNVVHSSVEVIEFTGNLGNYSFSINGNIVSVFSGMSSTVVTKIIVPDTQDGQKLVFADGSASLVINGLNDATLGNADITSTQKVITTSLNEGETSGMGSGNIFTLTGAYETVTHTDPAGPADGTIWWNGIPVESSSIEEYFLNIAATKFAELGKDLNSISGVEEINFNNEDGSATVTLNTADGLSIDVNTTVTLEYLAMLKNMIFDENGVSRLTFVQDADKVNTYNKAVAIVLTPEVNNGGSVENGFTTDGNDTIVAGRPELLHGAYIDAGGGLNNVLEVEMKGVFAQPLELLNIQQINVENAPNIYTQDGRDHDGGHYFKGADGKLTYYPPGTAGSYPNLASDVDITDSALDLTNARDLQLLVISEVQNFGDITEDHVHVGDLTIAGIRNNATVRLEGNFTQDVTLQFGEGVGVDPLTGLYDGEVNIELRLGDTDNFDLNVAQNASVLHIDSQGYENILDCGDFGGNIGLLKITGTGALIFEEGLEGFRDGSIIKPAVVDASGMTGGGVVLGFENGEQPFVKFVGSNFSDEFYANGSTSVTIQGGIGNDVFTANDCKTVLINANNGDNVINADQSVWSDNFGSAVVTINAGTGADVISAVRADKVTINAAGGDNDITASANVIKITTTTGDDTITISGMDTKFIEHNTDDNYDYNIDADEMPGALLNINVGTGNNTIVLGRDVEIGWSTVEFGVTALKGSIITGSGIELYVANESNLTQAALTGVTSVVLEEELTITAKQFNQIGAAAFSVNNDVFGETEELIISVDGTESFATTDTDADGGKAVKLSDMVDLSQLDNNVRLKFELHNDVRLIMSAEELHTYCAPHAVTTDDGLNGEITITDAGLEFSAFSNGPDHEVIDGGTLDGWSGHDLVIIRTTDGYERPDTEGMVDYIQIDSDVTPVVSGFTTEATTLKIIGDADLDFNGAIDLGANFTIDFSKLTGAMTDLTVKNFNEVKQVIGNGADDVRINIELAGNVGTAGEANGLKTSGVAEYVVTKIADIDHDSTADDTVTIYLCDNSKDIQVLGLQGNMGNTVVFENVRGATFLLEGDGGADYSDVTKALDNQPNESNIGTMYVNFFDEGVPAIVNINNQGVPLGVTSTGEDRPLVIDGIDIDNANSITINVADGNAIINDLDGDKVDTLTFNSDFDVTVSLDDFGSQLKTINGADVDGDLTLDLSGSNDFHSTVLTGVDAILLDGTLTLNADQVEALAAVIHDSDTANVNSSTLNVVNYGAQPIDFSAIDVDHISITTAGGTSTLVGDMSNVDSITVPDDGVLTLTADQFMALEGSGTIIAPNATVNITGLTQSHIDAGFSLANVTAEVGTIAIDGNVNLDDSTTIPSQFTILLSDGEQLGVATFTQADGLAVTGTGTTTVQFNFVDTDAFGDDVDSNDVLPAPGLGTSLDCSGYNVSYLRALNTFVDGLDQLFLFNELPASVTRVIFASPGAGTAMPIDIFEEVVANVTVPGLLAFNDLDPGPSNLNGVVEELHNLDITLHGGATISDSNGSAPGGDSIRIATVDKDPLLQAGFNLLTIHSEGDSANTITGDITPFGAGVANNLLNVDIDTTEQALAIGGSIVFNVGDGSVLDDQAAAGTVATLEILTGSTENVTIAQLDVDDADLTALNIVNNGIGTLTITGGSPAIDGDSIIDNGSSSMTDYIEAVNISGNGAVVLGTGTNTSVDAEDLSTLDASGLAANLTIRDLADVDSSLFAFKSSTGVTTMTVTDDMNADGNWSFDFTGADPGSRLELKGVSVTTGDLSIELGTDATLLISSDMDLSDLDSFYITPGEPIYLAQGVTLKVTAEQASNLDIQLAPGATSANINVVDLGDAPVDLSGIDLTGGLVGIVTLVDNDVTLDPDTDLGMFTVHLYDVADNTVPARADELQGQTIRFQTVEQAERTITVDANDGLGSTNVVWLFSEVTAPVNTNGYSAGLDRLWFYQGLIDGENVEQLFTSLPSTILREEVQTLAALAAPLDESLGRDRVLEQVAFSQAPLGLIFSDEDRLEHVQSLTINMGGQVTDGPITIDNLVNPTAGVDLTSIVFNELTINSWLADDTGDLLASELFVEELHVKPTAANIVGNISVGTNAPGLDLLTVNLNTHEDLAGNNLTANSAVNVLTGNDLQVGTITFDSEVAASAHLNVTGANDINITVVNTTDADITTLAVDATGFTGVLTAPGASAGFQVNNTETITFNNANVAAGTITLGNATNAGVIGNTLSFINAENFDGALNLGTIALIDGTNDNRNADLDTTDAYVDTLNPGDAAFVFTSGDGINTMRLAADPDNAATAPSLAAGSEWVFNFTNADPGSRLTIANTAQFAAGAILTLINAPVVIEGTVDLSDVILDITAGSISVPAGSTLILDVAQLQTDIPIDITGSGTVKVVGDASNITLGSHLLTVGVDISAVTIVPTDVVADPLTNDDTDNIVDLVLIGATNDAGNPAGQSVIGSANVDAIVTGNLADTISGGLLNDILTGQAGNDTYTVTAGTDTIIGLATGDIFNVSATATATAALASGFVATAATTNAGTAILTAAAVSSTIDMSLAGGPNGYSLTGNTVESADTLIGSAFADIINGGDILQQSSAGADILTGKAGADIFQFNVNVNSAATMTVNTIHAAVDSELITITAQSADANDESLVVNYTVNGIAGQAIIALAAIDSTSATAVAAAVALGLDGQAGVSATSALGVVTATGELGSALTISSVNLVGTNNGLSGAISNGTDIAQETTVTVTGTPTTGDVYSLLGDLFVGGGASASYTAVASDTAALVAAGLAADFVSGAITDAIIDPINAANVITFTASNADNGGFSMTKGTLAAFAGSGASAIGAGSLATADIITDFVSGVDKLDFTNMPAALDGVAGDNYAEAVAAADFTTALGNANTAFDSTVMYYLTASTADNTGLLFFDANLDGNADGVVSLVGITSANFAATDIIA